MSEGHRRLRISSRVTQPGLHLRPGTRHSERPKAAYTRIKAAAIAGDPRGNEMLAAFEKQVPEEQLAEANEQASKLQQAEKTLSARSFGQ